MRRARRVRAVPPVPAYNDLRFAKDRPPYKTQQGAYAEGEGGAGYYLQISAPTG